MKHIFKVLGGLFTVMQLGGLFPALGQPLLSPAPAAVSKADGPRIKFSETVFDFGQIQSSRVVRHDFIVTNTGNAPLEITEVRPGCPGCTTALPWDHEIKPGKTGKIPIQFNPASFSGPVSKSVTVTCNDPNQGNHTLQFQATVWRPVDVQPGYVYFMPVEGEETNETKIVRISNRLEEPLTLEPPQCSNPAFKMEMKTVQPGKEFELLVSYAGLASNAVGQSSITIKTSSTNLPVINVTVHAMPQPALVVMPARIILPARALNVGHRHSQMIRNNSSAPIKVTEAAVNAEGVTVQITEPQPGKQFMLSLNFPPNFQAPPGESLELTIHTSHPKRPILRVPIILSSVPAPAKLKPLSTVPVGPK